MANGTRSFAEAAAQLGNERHKQPEAAVAASRDERLAML
jgi:hypothetical protein